MKCAFSKILSVASVALITIASANLEAGVTTNTLEQNQQKLRNAAGAGSASKSAGTAVQDRDTNSQDKRKACGVMGSSGLARIGGADSSVGAVEDLLTQVNSFAAQQEAINQEVVTAAQSVGAPAVTQTPGEIAYASLSAVASSESATPQTKALALALMQKIGPKFNGDMAALVKMIRGTTFDFNGDGIVQANETIPEESAAEIGMACGKA